MKHDSKLLKTCFKLVFGWILFTFLFRYFTNPTPHQLLGIPTYFSGEFLLFTNLIKNILVSVIMVALLLIIIKTITVLIAKRSRTD